MTTRNLQALFHPRDVAVIGGSSRAGSLGAHVLDNIIDGGFAGSVCAINPKQVDRSGCAWLPSIDALPVAPELAVVVTPAHAVPQIIAELGAKGTRVAVVLSAGLHDPALRDAMLQAAQPHCLRIVGPNCLGVLLPHARLDASFAPRSAAAGGLAFVSQSGALVTAMLDWASDKHLGFSAVLSVGDMADVDLGDLIDMLAADPNTHAILLYVEAVTNPAKFMSAARAASRIKPVIAIKAGRSASAGAAAMSHTGALVGSYDVYAAAFERAGVVLVDDLTELFDAAQVLCRYSPSAGNRLAIVSNGGGAGVLAADGLARTRGMLAVLSPATIAALDPVLPPGWSRHNPIDVVGDARSDRFCVAATAALTDPGTDALLVIHCPTAVADGREIAREFLRTLEQDKPKKPLIACWMGTANADAARGMFDAAGIPLFDNIDDAVRGFDYLLRAHIGQQSLLRAPSRVTVPDTNCARAGAVIIERARSAGRAILDAGEAKALLAAYGVPTAAARIVPDVDTLGQVAVTLEPPYALKVVSPELTHKSDVGGVRLNILSTAELVAAAQAMAAHIAEVRPDATITGFEVEPMVSRDEGEELLIGITRDATFGPVIAFGAGGKAVEVVADRALGLPPLDDQLAGDMIDRTRVAGLLHGYRDVPAVDRKALVHALNALSAIAIDLPDVAELEVNPLLATADGVTAVDARGRILIEPRPSQLVIRPVPAEWTADLVTRSGLKLHVRPVVPQDENLLADLFAHMTPEDLHFRFLEQLSSVGRDRIAPMCQVDYARTINFLAFGDETLVASAVLVANPDRTRAELAVAVREGYKGKGVSWTLLGHVIRFAESEGIETVESLENRDNHSALSLERELGFRPVPSKSAPGDVLVRLQLTSE